MKRTYEVRDRADKRAIREFLKREGQFLLPMLELVEQTEVAIDEVIQVMGRATIEAVLEMSAEGVAGVKQAGRSRAEDDTVWYGRQGGVVYLSDRKVRVERPRLRRRGAGAGGEVEVPAYTAMRRPGAVADRMLEVLMAGVSTRKYGRVIGEMADTVGVSKSAVSRETVEASEHVLKELMERRLDAWDLLVIYLDGIQMGSHHVLAAVGVDSDGKKHVLGVREGASENAEVTSALLEDLVERGLDPGRRRLFVIDGSKALRKAIEKVFGQRHPIQRCRNHKLRNVLGHLPKDQHPQVKAAFRAAMKLDAKQGEQKLEQLARWLERDHPSASASLREGLSEMFTINRLGLPPRLRKCLGSTNLIDSTHSGVRQKTRRVTHWKNGAMALRWAAASFVETEKSYRRIIGYDQLWMLRAHLDDHETGCRNEKGRLTRRLSGATTFNCQRDTIVIRPRRTSLVHTAAGIDEGSYVGVEEDEARDVPGESRTGQPLEDVGVAVEVNAPDQRDIPHRSCAHRPVREPTQAQGGIPFAVDLYVVESVRDAVVEQVDEEEAVAERPARCLLEGQDVRVVLRSVKGVGELAVLIVKLRLCGRPDRCSRKNRHSDKPAPERTSPGKILHDEMLGYCNPVARDTAHQLASGAWKTRPGISLSGAPCAPPELP